MSKKLLFGLVNHGKTKWAVMADTAQIVEREGDTVIAQIPEDRWSVPQAWEDIDLAASAPEMKAELDSLRQRAGTIACNCDLCYTLRDNVSVEEEPTEEAMWRSRAFKAEAVVELLKLGEENFHVGKDDPVFWKRRAAYWKGRALNAETHLDGTEYLLREVTDSILTEAKLKEANARIEALEAALRGEGEDK